MLLKSKIKQLFLFSTTFKSFAKNEFFIPLNKISISFSRSSGAGGQNVNKVNTKVEMRFNVDTSDWLSHQVKERLKELYPNKINTEGEFILTSQEHRTQEENKREAEKKLKDIINEAMQPKNERIILPPEYTEEQKEKRRISKVKSSQTKNLRKNGNE